MNFKGNNNIVSDSSRISQDVKFDAVHSSDEMKILVEYAHQKNVESGGWLGKAFGVDTNKSIIYSGIILCAIGLVIRFTCIFLYKYWWCENLDMTFLDGFIMLVAGYVFGSSRNIQ